MIRMPQFRIRDRRTGLIEHQRGMGGHGQSRLHLRHAGPGRIANAGLHRGVFGRIGIIGHFGLHLHRASFAGNLRRGHKRAIPGHMQGRSNHQPHVPVNAPAKRMLPGPRSKTRVPTIVHPHRHHVVPLFHRLGDIKYKTGVAALVFADAFPVHEHFRHLEHTVKFQRNGFTPPTARHGDMLAIPPIAFVKLGRGKVRHRERMRQPHVRPRRIIEPAARGRWIAQLKFPFPIQVNALPEGLRRLRFINPGENKKPQNQQSATKKYSHNSFHAYPQPVGDEVTRLHLKQLR